MKVKKRVANIEFVATVPTKTLGGVQAVSLRHAHAVEVQIARQLIARGIVHAEAFAFVRKAAKLRAVELAALLDVDVKTISRWETEQTEIPRSVWAVVAGLFGERVSGQKHPSLVRVLEAAASPKRSKSILVKAA